MNTFGGNWTENKIEILVEYARAYLSIMSVHAKKYGWKLMYFDGFAGSGLIVREKKEYRKEIVGAARRIIEIEEPMPFDEYYFVEMDKENMRELEQNTKIAFPKKKIHTVTEDCNIKLNSLANFLGSTKGKNYKILAFIDPCGMQLKWESIENLKNLPIDIWILVPTGMGVSRLLKNDGNITEEWLSKLEVFLGMKREEILQFFYKEQEVQTLFGPETVVTKKEKAIGKSAELYKSRLSMIFKFVSETYVLKTEKNNTLFHFLLASNNENANKIANEIVRKYNKKN
ncbi:MAG: three-Cys-motif partner protein TcmP [Saprospiraceae bacterium]